MKDGDWIRKDSLYYPKEEEPKRENRWGSLGEEIDEELK